MILLLGLMVAVGAPLAERDARGVVDGWLAAQNAGDWAAYDKLYATKFTGIRRSGPRTVRFHDARRLLLLAFTVATNDVTFKLLDGEAPILDGQVRQRE